MSYTLIPIAPESELSINSVPLGAVCSFSEQTVGVPIAVHAIGRSLPVAVINSAVHYELRLSWILTDANVLTQTLSPHSLHGFAVKLSGGGRTVRFTGCEFTSLTVRSEVGTGTLAEAVICAASRTETA